MAQKVGTRGGGDSGIVSVSQGEFDLIEMKCIAITKFEKTHLSRKHSKSSRPRLQRLSSFSALALSSLSPLSLLRFHNAKSFARSPSPCFSLPSSMSPKQPDRRPYIPPAPKGDKHQASALFYDSGVAHGLQRAPSHRIRSFRRPVVYSNPLADLCVIISSFLMVHNLTCSVVRFHHQRQLGCDVHGAPDGRHHHTQTSRPTSSHPCSRQWLRFLGNLCRAEMACVYPAPHPTVARILTL